MAGKYLSRFYVFRYVEPGPFGLPFAVLASAPVLILLAAAGSALLILQRLLSSAAGATALEFALQAAALALMVLGVLEIAEIITGAAWQQAAAGLADTTAPMLRP